MTRFLLLVYFILANNAFFLSQAMANALAVSPSGSRKMAMPRWSVSPSATTNEEVKKTLQAPVVTVEKAVGKDSDSIGHSSGAVEEHVSVKQPGVGEPVYQEPEPAEGPGRTSRRSEKKHHSDKSIAFGGVMLAGLAATFMVSVIRYIRATRRRDCNTIPVSPKTPTTPKKPATTKITPANSV